MSNIYSLDYVNKLKKQKKKKKDKRNKSGNPYDLSRHPKEK